MVVVRPSLQISRSNYDVQPAEIITEEKKEEEEEGEDPYLHDLGHTSTRLLLLNHLNY